MVTAQKLWNETDLRIGGFYELAMEVSGNDWNLTQINDLLSSVFEPAFVHGPFDSQFNPSAIAVDMAFGYGEGLGYLEIDGIELPFKTIFISEQGENGSNWLDIGFYTAMYEKVLGRQYQTWVADAKCHEGLDELLMAMLTHVNQKYRIRLGAIGFEVSGMYYLEALKQGALTEHNLAGARIFVNANETLASQSWANVVAI